MVHHLPAKDLNDATVNHVNWQCILHFSILRIFAYSNWNPVYLSAKDKWYM